MIRFIKRERRRGRLERYVFVEIFLWRGGRGFRGATAPRPGSGRGITGLAAFAPGTGTAAFRTTAAQELKIVADHLHAAALFLRVFVFPLVEPEPAFDKQGTALRAILGDVLARFAPGLDVNIGHFLPVRTRFV